MSVATSDIDVPVPMNEQSQSPRKSLGLLNYPFRLPRRWRLAMVISAIVAVGVGGLDALTLALVVPLIDIVTGDSTGTSAATGWVETLFGIFNIPVTLRWIVIAILTLTLVRGVSLVGHIWLSAYYGSQYEVDIKRRAYGAILNAQWPFFLRQRTGDLSNTLTAESARATQAYGAMTGAVGSLLNVILYIAVAAAVSWQLTLAVVAATLVLILVFTTLTRIARRFGTGASEANSRLLSEITEGFGIAKTLKSQGMESSMEERFDPLARRRARFDVLLGLNSGAFFAVSEIAFILLLLGGILLGLQVLDQSTSTVALFTVLFVRLYQRARVFQTAILGYASFFPGTEIIERVTYEAQREAEHLGGKPFTGLNDGIRFSNVNFSYNEGSQILGEVTMDVPAGSMVAFVGPSGVGKTSVLDLTIGLLTPDSGTIFIDNVPLSEYDLRAWRSNIAYVAQDTVLFHDTIAANIAWGDPNATMDDIVSAAKLANAHEFIEQQPEGYDTVVGDRGTLISGGQRQRLALARALIRKPALLILDEATSELDTRSENMIKDALNEVRGTTTVMMVAHRYSTVGTADVIHVLKDGGIVESGNMDELLARKSHFYNLYMSSTDSETARPHSPDPEIETDSAAGFGEA